MTDWLLTNVPMWLLALLVIVVPSLVAMGTVWWVRRRVGLDALAANNDVGAALFGFTGTVYAIFLGFTVVLVWQEMGDTEAIVNHEATAFVSLYNTAQGLPDPAGGRLQQQLRAYILAVRDDEWEKMAYGESARWPRIRFPPCGRRLPSSTPTPRGSPACTTRPSST